MSSLINYLGIEQLTSPITINNVVFNLASKTITDENGTRQFSQDEYALFDAVDDAGLDALISLRLSDIQNSESNLALVAQHRMELQEARVLLLDYGQPGSFSYQDTLLGVEGAVLSYQSSGFKDRECEEHLLWIGLSSNRINSLRSLGILP